MAGSRWPRRFSSGVHYEDGHSESGRLGGHVRQRVGCKVHASRFLLANVSVHLRGAGRGMTEQFLDDAQVCAAVQEMGRVAVAQRVRVHVLPQSAALRVVPDDALDRACAEPRAARVAEQRAALVVRRALRIQVRTEGVPRFGAERHLALLRSLAPYADGALLQ